MPDIEIIARETFRLKMEIARARKLGLPATLTLDEWLCTLDRYQWKCAYCDGRFEVLEHSLPTRKGGGTTSDNCLPACKSCNIRKGSKSPLEWQKYIQKSIERRKKADEWKLRPLRRPIVTNLGRIRLQLGLHRVTLACIGKLSESTFMDAELGKSIKHKTALQILVAINTALTDANQPQVSLEDLELTIS